MYASIAKNPCNSGACWIMEISLILRSPHMVSKNQNKVVFYINNYIDWDQFNKFYDLDRMKKGISNTNVVTRNLRLALIKLTNHKLEIARKKQRKREEMVEKRKTKTITARWQKARRESCLSSKKKENYESDIKNKTDLKQAGNNKNPLQL